MDITGPTSYEVKDVKVTMNNHENGVTMPHPGAMNVMTQAAATTHARSRCYSPRSESGVARRRPPPPGHSGVARPATLLALALVSGGVCLAFGHTQEALPLG
jgi:hypothetical protein